MEKMTERNNSAIVVFGAQLPRQKNAKWWKQFDTLVASNEFESFASEHGLRFRDINDLIDNENIYKASAFAKELSEVTLPDGRRLSGSFVYKGYELWWAYYNKLFHFSCMPYIQYKRLLEYLKEYDSPYLFQCPCPHLFVHYFHAYERKVVMVKEPIWRRRPPIELGIAVQCMLTFISLPVLLVSRKKILLFIGDKFAKGKDYDFRMEYIYKELRSKGLSFVECIRSLESWRTVLKHFFVRKRPVIYSQSIVSVGHIISILTGGHVRMRRRLGYEKYTLVKDPEKRFRLYLAAQNLYYAYDDIYAILIMKLLIKLSGVKAGYFTAVLDRNIHAFVGCKLLGLPTVGIQHGVGPKDYFVSDFLPEYKGEKSIAVDKYGVWSEWWKGHYMKYSATYKPEQLYVSGHMRPLERQKDDANSARKKEQHTPTRVLFVAGEKSAPDEIMPYLDRLLREEGLILYLTFRPYRDAFETWLKKNHPELITTVGKERILLGNIHDAIEQCDVVVGTYSTAVLETLLHDKPVVFFNTDKWGDCFDLRSYRSSPTLFAEDPSQLIAYIKKNTDIPLNIIQELQERFFGDPNKNGSKWVVDELEKSINA